MRPIGVGSVPRARMIGLQITAMAFNSRSVRGAPDIDPSARSLAYSDLDDRFLLTRDPDLRASITRGRRGRPSPNERGTEENDSLDRWINAALCC